MCTSNKFGNWLSAFLVGATSCLLLLVSGCSNKEQSPPEDCQPLIQICSCQGGCPIGFHCQDGSCAADTQNTLNLDAKTAEVSGTLTLNGGSPAKACTSKDDVVAVVQLEEVNSGARTQIYAYCGSASAADPVKFQSTIFQGTYKVSVFGNERAYSLLPIGAASAFLINSSLAVSGDMPSMNLDVKGYTVSGTVTHNGGSPAKSCVTAEDEVAKVLLDETSSGRHIELIASCASTGAAAPITFSGPVPAGTYKVSVRGSYGGGTSIPLLPLVGAQVANSRLYIYSDTSGVLLDTKTFQLAGRVTLNGVSPSMMCPLSGGSAAKLLLDEVTSANHIELAVPCNSSGELVFDEHVYPGTYKVSVLGAGGGSLSTLLPLTEPQVVEPSLNMNADVPSRALDVKAYKVSGSVTLNGGPPQKLCASKGHAVGKVLFDEVNSKAHIEFAATCTETGATSAVNFSGYVYAGNYTVSLTGYAPQESTTLLPMPGAQIMQPPLAVNADKAGLFLDAKAYTVSGTVTRNGGRSQKSCANLPGGAIAKVLFDETTTGNHIELLARCVDSAAASNVTFSGLVYSGTYRVSVAGVDLKDGAVTSLPAPGAQQVKAKVVVNANVSALALDAKTVHLSGKVTQNGGPGGAACDMQGDKAAKVLLDELDSHSHIELIASCESSGMANLRFGDAVFPGVYRVSLVGISSYTTNIPELPPTPILPRLQIR